MLTFHFPLSSIVNKTCRIYKDKYSDEGDGKKKSSESRGRPSPEKEKGKEQKSRNKSRTRTMFGRKKSNVS